MPSFSSSSSSDDKLTPALTPNPNPNPNPNAKPIDDELSLASITLAESKGSGSVNESECNGGDEEAWGRKNSEVEVEVDRPSSPSNSGYVGERGMSSRTSYSRIDGDEIQEVRNDDGFGDGVHDSQTS